jgi:hypothetical protein
LHEFTSPVEESPLPDPATKGLEPLYRVRREGVAVSNVVANTALSPKGNISDATELWRRGK